MFTRNKIAILQVFVEKSNKLRLISNAI